MGKGSSNERNWDKAMERLKKLVQEKMEERLIPACDAIISHAASHKGYANFTGNTVTSYRYGLFINGELRSVKGTGDYMREPVHRPIRKGEFLFLNPDYDGRMRSYVGAAGSSHTYGKDYSDRRIRRLKGRVNTYRIRVTTGTEYSLYLETVHKANVLTDTFNWAGNYMQNILNKPLL